MCYSFNARRMKYSNFEAVVDSWPFPAKSVFKGFMAVEGQEIPVSVSRYKKEENESPQGQRFVRIHTGRPLTLSWKNSFEISDRKKGKILLKGEILLPFDGEIKPKAIKKRQELLQGLSGDEKTMVLALTQAHGVKGLTEKELAEFSALTKDSLFELSRQLEGERKIRILSFSPLFLLSQDSFDFLCERILAYLSEFHVKHPEDFGSSPEKIQKRFGLSRLVLNLSLKHLDRTGQIYESKKTVALRDFYPLPSPTLQFLPVRLRFPADIRFHSPSTTPALSAVERQRQTEATSGCCTLTAVTGQSLTGFWMKVQAGTVLLRRSGSGPGARLMLVSPILITTFTTGTLQLRLLRLIQ